MKKKWWKALLGSMFVLCMFVVANIYTDAAAGTVTEKDGMIIQEYTEIGSFRVAGDYKAPDVPSGYSGYVFAGWYKDENLEVALDADAASTSEEIANTATKYYAKFVPKEIFGVRVQISAGTTYASEKTNVRFVTSVDTNRYKAVGFKVEINGKSYSGKSEKVYRKLFVVNSNKDVMEDYLPQNVFHEMSQYFVACNLKNVAHTDYGDLLKATPYWITLDGTTVYGDTVDKTVNEAYTPSTVSVTATQIATLSRDTTDGASCYTQGACTDGTYFYQAFVYQAGGSEANDDTNDRVYIAKYEMNGESAEKTPILQSGNLDLHHANDITFNKDLSYTDDAEKSGLLVICHNSPERDRVSFVDPDTLAIVNPSTITDVNGKAIKWGDYVLEKTATYIQLGVEEPRYFWGIQIGTTKTPLRLFSIEYNATHQQYVVGIAGGNQTFRILNADFSDAYDKAFSPIDTEITAFTTQGVAADDKYIYFVLYNGKVDDTNITYNDHTGHVIAVYDWQGNAVRAINIATENGIPVTKEPENISVYDNNFYIGVGATNSLNLYQLNKDGWVSENTGNEAYIGSPEDDEYYTTLEEAVKNVDANEKITIIAENIEISSAMKVAVSGVTIQNEAGKNVVIKRGADYSGVVFENSASDLTITSNTSGSLSFSGSSYAGSSYVHNIEGGTLTLDGLAFKNIESTAKGAAIYATAGTVNINECEFNNNTAKFQGGALWIASAAEATVTNSKFIENKTTNQTGGAIWKQGKLTLESTDFTGNEAATTGGAINCDGGEMDVTDCDFTSNKANSGEGGAMQVANNSVATITATGTDTGIFGKNTATGTGGAIRANNASLTITGYKFDGNESEKAGGAIYVGDGVVYQADAKVTLADNIFVSNKSKTANGGAIYNAVRDVDITGCIFGGSETVDVTDENDVVTKQTVSLGNTAAVSGGAIYQRAGVLTVTGGTFDGNKAVTESTDDSTGQGGAIYLASGSSASMTSATFKNNESTRQGGAIYNFSSSLVKEGTDLLVKNCTFGGTTTTTDENGETVTTSQGNIAGTYGGAIYNGNSSALELVEDSETAGTALFEGNKTKAGYGGAVGLGTGSLSVDGYTFKNNEAHNATGGAIQLNGTAINATINKTKFIGNKTVDENTEDKTYYAGGAVYTRAAELTIKGKATFDGNSAYQGGAIYPETGEVSIENSKFYDNNAANQGGAIYVPKGKTVTVSDSNFEGNNTTSSNGGAVYVYQGTLTLNSVEFISNQAKGTGGAIHSEGGTIEAATCHFTKNKAAGQGGACRIVAGGSAEFTGKGTFTKNESTGNLGGAIQVNSATLTVGEYTFDGNIAKTDGGAVFIQYNTKNPTFTNTKFTSNEAKGNGGAIYTQKAVTLTDVTFGGGDKEVEITNDDGTTGTTTVSLGNTATNGGAIYVSGTTTEATVKDEVTGESTKVPVYNVGALNASGGIFQGNTATTSGGAIYLDKYEADTTTNEDGTTSKTGTSAKLNGITFIKNEAKGGHGGAIYTESVTTVKDTYGLTVEDCTFGAKGDTEYANANKTTLASNINAYGGAIYVTTGNAKIENTSFLYNQSRNGAAVGAQSANIVKIIAGDNAEKAVFEGNNSTNQGGAIRFYVTANDTEIKGYTFKSNKATGNGGAVQADQKTNLTVSNCVFNNNSTNAEGGALQTYSSIEISGSEFYKNAAKNGGAISFARLSQSNTIKDCTFGGTGDLGNTALENGGAIYSAAQSLVLSDDKDLDVANVFIGNKATSTEEDATANGGAICVVEGVTNVTGYTFQNNEANGGGAVYVSGHTASGKDYAGTFEALTCEFTGNTATTSGGAVYLDSFTVGTSATLNGATFTKNEATSGNGGAVYSTSTKTTEGEEAAYGLNVTNCTFGTKDDTEYASANKATSGYGGAIYVTTSGQEITTKAQVVDTSFYHNKANNGGAVGTNEEQGTCIVEFITSDKSEKAVFAGNHANNQGGAIRFWGVGSGTSIDGYTFDSNTAVKDGGAIKADQSAKADVKNCKFDTNVTSEGNGGAISIASGSAITLTGSKAEGNISVFSGNIATKGNGGALATSTAGTYKIYDYTFTGNQATAGNGGAIYTQATLEVKDTAFGTADKGNSAVNGGAIYSTGTATITDTTFGVATTDADGKTVYVGNTASNNGGAIYVEKNTVTLKSDDATNKPLVVGNTAINGCAVYVYSGELSATNYEFANHETTENGGAIYLGEMLTEATTDEEGNAVPATYSLGNLTTTGTKFSNNNAKRGGAVYALAGTASIENSEFSDNSATDRAGALYVEDNATVTKLDNSILSKNSSGASGGAIFNTGTLNMTATTFSENEAGSVAGAINCESGVMTAESCSFVSNTSVGNGGAVQVASKSDATFSGTGTFQGNKAGTWKEVTDEATGAVSTEVDSLAKGGAIRTNNSLLSVTGYTFDGNSATSTGGAVDIGDGAATSADGTTTEEDDEKIKFSGAKFINNKAESAGGAICNGVVDGAAGRNMTIDGCVFGDSATTGNNAGGIGGAIHQRAKELKVTNTSFFGNKSSSNGGAIYGAYSAKITLNGTDISKSVFQENEAEGTWGGGAIDIGSGTLDVTGYKFKGNKAINSVGGAIGIHTSTIVTTITNSVFESNEAVGNGGAISNQSTKTGVDTLTITNSTFGGENVGNKSTGGNGGAIYINTKGSVNITGTDDAAIFKGNSTVANSKSGGAIYVNAGSLKVNNYTFDTNNAKQQGGAIWMNTGTSGTIESSEFTGNSTTSASGGAIYKKGELTIRKTDFIGNTAYSIAGAINSDAGDITIQNCNFNLNRSGIKSDGNVRDGQNVGAIQVNGGKATIEVTDNEAYTFSGNEASGNGGAILVTGSEASLEIKKTDGVTGTLTFTGNKADNGGAIYFANNASASSIEDATFNGNEATSGNGGALYANVDVTITDTDFGATDAGNKATGNGGAIYLTNGKTVTLTKSETVTEKPAFTANSVTGEASLGGAIFTDTGVINATEYSFEGNTAPNGGAIYVGEVTVTETPVVDENGVETGEVTTTTTTESGTLTATSCNFSGNIADSQGGACYIIAESTATITGSTFTKNKANAGHGGAVYNGSSKTTENEVIAYGVNISGCTFGDATDTAEGDSAYAYANTATSYGGAVYGASGTNTQIANTSFYYNKATDGGAVGTHSAGAMLIEAANVGDAEFVGNYASNQGGAVRLMGCVKGTITNYTFTSNVAVSYGGALEVERNSMSTGEVYVNNCKFDTNSSTNQQGGAIRVAGSGKVYLNQNTENNGNAIFSNNSAKYGGALATGGSGTYEIYNYAFDDNHATTGQGGAIYSKTTLKVESTEFSNNDSKVSGGAIHSEGGTKTINYCKFVSNETEGYGGAISSAASSTTTITGGTEDSIFQGNIAGTTGGALYNGGSGKMNVYNYTFTGNTAGTDGNAIYFNYASTTAFIVKGCVFNADPNQTISGKSGYGYTSPEENTFNY